MTTTRQLTFLATMTKYCRDHLPRDALGTVGSMMIRLGLCVEVSGLSYYYIQLWHTFAILMQVIFSMNYVNVLDNYVDMQEKCKQNFGKKFRNYQ